MSLQVAVNHENLVAAWMRAGSLSHLLVMLLDVLLNIQQRNKADTYTVKSTDISQRSQILNSHSFLLIYNVEYNSF